ARRDRRGFDLYRLRMHPPSARRRAASVRARDVRALPQQSRDRVSYLWRAIWLDAREPDPDRRRDRKAAGVIDTPRNANVTAELRREAEKLKKTTGALMSRVERSMDRQFSAFSLFETAIALAHRVRDRTRQLRDALHSIERANESLYRAKQQAEAASSLKSSVLISVTHDLLQPVHAARLTLWTLPAKTEPNVALKLAEQDA